MGTENFATPTQPASCSTDLLFQTGMTPIHLVAVTTVRKAAIHKLQFPSRRRANAARTPAWTAKRADSGNRVPSQLRGPWVVPMRIPGRAKYLANRSSSERRRRFIVLLSIGRTLLADLPERIIDSDPFSVFLVDLPIRRKGASHANTLLLCSTRTLGVASATCVCIVSTRTLGTLEHMKR